ncbi:MAG: hypothetical protein ACM67P_02920 [Clostridiales bacterium]
MTGFDRGIADDGGLDPEEVLKLFLILAAVMDQGRITGSSDRRGAGHKGQGRRDRRHRHEDRRGFLSRRWRLNRKSSAQGAVWISVSGMEAQQKLIGVKTGAVFF